MINLFNIEKYNIDTSKYSNVIHDGVKEFEEEFAKYVGAKYACGVSSATNAIMLALHKKNAVITIPTMIPPVVANAVLTSNNLLKFKDDTEWVGDSYILHNFGDYKIIDSAQKCERNQFKIEANDNDLMIFSFYPTKPVGSIDGGMIVSNDLEKIKWFREATLNGMGFANNNWERVIKFPGWKMYLNSFQAEIASKNLDRIDEKQNKLKEIRDFYNNELGYSNTSNHLYRIDVNKRDNFIKYMKNKGVICGIHYQPLHTHPVYKTQDICSKSIEKAKTTVSIPFHEKLTFKDIKIIIKLIKYGL